LKIIVSASNAVWAKSIESNDSGVLTLSITVYRHWWAIGSLYSNLAWWTSNILFVHTGTNFWFPKETGRTLVLANVVRIVIRCHVYAVCSPIFVNVVQSILFLRYSDTNEGGYISVRWLPHWIDYLSLACAVVCYWCDGLEFAKAPRQMVRVASPERRYCSALGPSD
jgi:hypothetical protein